MNQSDADQYHARIERAMFDETNRSLLDLSKRDIHLIYATRVAFSMLMLSLAVKLEAGVKPALPARDARS